VSKEEREFLDDLRTKSIEAAAEIMESLQRLKLLYDEITEDGSGNPLPRPRPGDFFYRLARFELEHASNVIRLGNSQAEMVFDHVRQLARRTKPGGASPLSVVTLTANGKNYSGTFDVKNTFDHDADAMFEISKLRTASGQEQEVTPEVTCGPGPIGPYRTAQVQISVPAKGVTETLFGEVTVFFVADVQRQVARRAIKVRPGEQPAAKGPAKRK
jgi:hypothetical protein